MSLTFNMKKLFLTLFLALGLVFNCFAQEKSKVFPERGVLNFLGMDDTSSSVIVQDGRAANIQNITIDLSGQAQKRYGYSYKVLLDTAVLTHNFEPVTGLYELYKSDLTRTKLTVCGSYLFSWTLAGAKTALNDYRYITEGKNYQFSWVTALDTAIATNEYDPPFKTSGTNFSNFDFTGLTYSITKAKCVIWWKNYLIFGNTTENNVAYTTRIRWSNVGTIDTWSNNDYVDIATLGGQQIEGFGILYDNLYIFLTDSIYKVSLVGGDELIVVTQVSENIGCIAKNSIKNISVNNSEGLVFLSRDATINFLDGIRVTEISTLISGVMDDLDKPRLPYAIGEVDNPSGHYYLAVTDSTDPVDNSINNLLLDYNFSTGEWSKHSQIDINAMCIANDSNGLPQVYFGNYKSFIYQLNDSFFESDVGGYNGYISTTNNLTTTTASALTILYDSTLSSYTALLLHCNGISGTTDFIDEALHSITSYGNVKLDTSNNKFGNASGLFDGIGDYLSTDDSDDWNFGTGKFTIDLWIKFTTGTLDSTLTESFVQQNTAAAGTYRFWYDDVTHRLYAGSNNAAGTDWNIRFYSSWTPSADIWYHIAFVRDGLTAGTHYIFVDGVSQSLTLLDGAWTGAWEDFTGTLRIGSNEGPGWYLNGWIDEPRISKGIARWTANFTSPTTAYDNSGITSRFKGATISITSGTGKSEERVICDTTITGIVVTNSSTATTDSGYSIGKIDAYYTTKWYDCGNPSLRKNFKDLFLWMTKKNTHTADILYATDESSNITSGQVVNYDTDSLWGTNIVDGSTWSGEELTFVKFPLNVSGRFLKLKFAEDGIDESMNLLGYSIVYEPLDIY